MSRRQVGYVLLALGLLLIIFSWTKSYPLRLESRDSFLFDFIHPSFWIGLSIANAALFLIASASKSSWERLACAFTFLILSFSMAYFFTFLGGPDSNTFRGLTENVVANGALSPELHFYHEWPLLFILGATVSEVLGVSVNLASLMLFFIWTFLLASGLFFYTKTKSDITDFMAVIAYGISIYPFIVWQYSAQTFALSLFAISIGLVSKKGLPYTIVTTLIFVAMVFAHPFFAVFLILATFLMAIRNRKRMFLAIIFSLLYSLNLVFQGVFLVHQIQSVLYLELFGQYLAVTLASLGGAASQLDALAQTVSRSVTLSMWAVLGIFTFLALLSRRLRVLDISVGVSGLVYAVIGAFLSILGERAIQIAFFPTSHSLRAFSLKSRQQRVLGAYFLLAMIIFPIGLVHYFYNDTSYMTFGEQHAAATIYLPLSQARGTDLGLIRLIVRGYLDSKLDKYVDYVSEWDVHGSLFSVSHFRFVFISPEFEHALQLRGLSENELLGLERSTVHFSRIYSNGYATVLMNPNSTRLA